MIAPNKDSRQEKKKPKAKTPFGRFALWGIAILLAAGVAAVLALSLLHKEPEPQEDKATKRGKATEASPAIKKIPSAVNKPTATESKPEKPPFVKRPGAMQLPDGRILTFKPPKEGEFRIVHSHGSTYKCDHLGNWEDVTPKPVFDNAFEETLVGLATTGNFIPGMLMGIDYDYAIKMLTKPVVGTPDAPNAIVVKKEAVAAAK